MLGDPDKTVRISSSWCLERVCEAFPEVLENEKNCEKFMGCFLLQIQNKATNKIISHLCHGLHYFAIYLRPHPEQVSSKKYFPKH